MRHFAVYFLAISTVLVSGRSLQAQNWARSMFATTSHNFGTVARAAETEFAFEFTNRLGRDVHVAYARTSCGCTTPRVERQTVPAGEKGAIIAHYNTRSFYGQRGATITVVFDRPSYAEVQLRVDGYIRRDVVFNPGSVDFGNVSQGQSSQRTIDLQYAGRNDWRVASIHSPLPYLTTKTVEKRRAYGRVGYDVIVELSGEAPPGYLDTELVLETNDRNMPRVPLSVSGLVSAPLTVSPALLYLGQVRAGGQANGRLVVRGAKPFRIVDVKCEDERFRFEFGDQAKTLHFLPVTFTADDKPGEVSVKIQIVSDLDGGTNGQADASATITSPN